jgi:pilus assembly protein CpaE
MGIKISDAEETLDFLIAAHIPSDGKIVVPALNEGIPFVLSNPTARVSLALQHVLKLVSLNMGHQDDLKEERGKSLFRRIFK